MTKTHSTRKKPSRQSLSGGVDSALLKRMADDFSSTPHNQLMQNAVTAVSVKQLAMRREVFEGADHSFSVKLDNWSATNQKSSGRCWMFAGLNMIRPYAMNKMKVKNFEFSQNFILYWDKLERANYFLNAMIQTADRDMDDRTVHHLLSKPIDDGGQWNMLVNVINKYGLVPKAAMPETESSSSTREMNAILQMKLRQTAANLRGMHADGASPQKLSATREAAMIDIHRILRIHLGNPPETFVWQWHDKDKKFHRNRATTPVAFAKRYVERQLSDYVCLVNDPRNEYGKTYTVDFLGNVVGGDTVVYLNVDIEMMKSIARKTLEDGEPVWFGCDVGKAMDGKQGFWDADMHDFEGIYSSSLAMDKKSRLLHGATCMTHAMLFTGVDVVAGKPRRWRVENSWGTEKADKGFYLMNDSWFAEHMFEIAAHQRHLPEELLAALKQSPRILPAWDPMGSLAF